MILFKTSDLGIYVVKSLILDRVVFSIYVERQLLLIIGVKV